MTTEELLAENERLHRMILEMAERIAAASEVLAHIAEKKKRTAPPVKCWLANRYTGRRCNAEEAG